MSWEFQQGEQADIRTVQSGSSKATLKRCSLCMESPSTRSHLRPTSICLMERFTKACLCQLGPRRMLVVGSSTISTHIVKDMPAIRPVAFAFASGTIQEMLVQSCSCDAPLGLNCRHLMEDGTSGSLALRLRFPSFVQFCTTSPALAHKMLLPK